MYSEFRLHYSDEQPVVNVAALVDEETAHLKITVRRWLESASFIAWPHDQVDRGRYVGRIYFTANAGTMQRVIGIWYTM